MIGTVAAQVALLAFAGAIVAGLSAGNSATTVLIRALATLAAGLVLGSAAAFANKFMLRDQAEAVKRQIDEEHVRASAASDDVAS